MKLRSDAPTRSVLLLRGLIVFAAVGFVLAGGERQPSVARRAAPTAAPLVGVVVKAMRSVAADDAAALEARLMILLANSDCSFRLVPPGSSPELRLEVELLAWQERQEPGGHPVFDTSTGRYNPGVKREVLVRYLSRVVVVASGKVLKAKDLSFRQVESSSSNPLFDPELQARIRARSRAGNTLRALLCKASRRYLKQRRKN